MARKKLIDTETKKFFPDEQGNLFEKSYLEEVEERNSRPVKCLGMTFPNDDERRKHFLDILREKLKDPEFRKIEGFPIGADEDILALSDPPYYTACPNPFIADFIKHYGKPYDPSIPYSREPFAADVSEGKNDPIYNAHSYHTKVPRKAIMRYILHYTEPGDVVFDGFCGTGMTGVAAQMCGDRNVVMELGYQVKPDGTILREEADEDGKKTRVAFSKLGVRLAVLNDLSPAATFIAYNYNAPVDIATFEKEAKRILKEVEEECGWMYETKHSDGRTGKINYTVWSEVFNCPHCGKEVVYFDAAVDEETFVVKNDFICPHCAAELDKKSMQRQWQSYFDEPRNETHRLVRYAPVLINYQVASSRHEKKPDEFDLRIMKRIEETAINDWFPNFEMPDGERKRKDGYHLKCISHLHHFYFRRAMMVYSRLWGKLNSCSSPLVRFFVQGNGLTVTKMYFLPDQAIEFDKRRITVSGVKQISFFVIDEASAIQWLRRLIKEKPQFMKQLGGYSKNEQMLELLTLLEHNFLCYDGKGEVPNQIHSYLSTNFKELRNLPKDDESLRGKGKDRWYVPDPNKAGDLEKLRERSLLKEFEEYRAVGASGRSPKLKVFRLEAVRAGFKKAWQERDYATIITVARKIPENVLQEDPKLLMWYDQALTRMGGE